MKSFKSGNWQASQLVRPVKSFNVSQDVGWRDMNDLGGLSFAAEASIVDQQRAPAGLLSFVRSIDR